MAVDLGVQHVRQSIRSSLMLMRARSTPSQRQASPGRQVAKLTFKLDVLKHHKLFHVPQIQYDLCLDLNGRLRLQPKTSQSLVQTCLSENFYIQP